MRGNEGTFKIYRQLNTVETGIEDFTMMLAIALNFFQ